MILNAKSIKPLADYVLIAPVDPETKTASGILLPETSKEKPQVGEIKAVGPGSINDAGKQVAMTVKVGQKVMYKKWGGNEIKVGNEEWLLVQEKDIIAVVE